MEVNLFPNFVQSPLFGHAMINLPIPLQSLQVRYSSPDTSSSPLTMLSLVLILAAMTCCVLLLGCGVWSCIIIDHAPGCISRCSLHVGR